MKNDMVIARIEKQLARHVSKLDIDKDRVSSHLKVAFSNIKEMIAEDAAREYGVVPDDEAKQIAILFEQAMNSYLSEWAEWFFNKQIEQFQNSVSKEIKRSAQAACDQYLKKRGMPEEELKAAMGEVLFKNDQHIGLDPKAEKVKKDGDA